MQVKNKDITFVSKDGIQRGTVNIFGRVTGITGKVAQTFEDTVQVDVPPELLEKTMEHSSLYWKAVPLRPGRYRIDMVVKDVNGDRVGTWSHGHAGAGVQRRQAGVLVADPGGPHGEGGRPRVWAPAASSSGETKLAYPHLDGADGKPASFKHDQRMTLWMQVYNLAGRRQNQEAVGQDRIRNRQRGQQSGRVALLGVDRHHGQRGRPDHAGKELVIEQLFSRACIG